MPYKDPEDLKQRRREYYLENKAYIDAKAKLYKKANRAACNRRTKNWELKKKYGKDLAWFEAKVASQNGLCAICEQEPVSPNARHQNLKVDHNHKTGVLRGLLCNGCNLRLGWFEKYEDEILMYLMKNFSVEVTSW